MDLVNAYLKSLVFVKVEVQENFTVYQAAIPSMLGDGYHYFLAFVPVHLAILNRARLHELNWRNLQARTIKKKPPFPTQKWEFERGLPDPIFNLETREARYSRYRSPGMPFEMLLIHDPKKSTKYQYHAKMNLSSALNTFACVLNFEGEEPSPVAATSPARAAAAAEGVVDSSFEFIT